MAADPGKFPGQGASNPKKKKHSTPRWFLLPHSLVSVAQFLSSTNRIRYSWFWFPSRGTPGGIRASDLQASSLNYLVAHRLEPPKSGIHNPKSGRQNPKNSGIQNPNFLGLILGISNFGYWILGFGFGILDFGPLCSNSSCAFFLDFGFWIFGQILDAT